MGEVHVLEQQIAKHNLVRRGNLEEVWNWEEKDRMS